MATRDFRARTTRGPVSLLRGAVIGTALLLAACSGADDAAPIGDEAEPAMSGQATVGDPEPDDDPAGRGEFVRRSLRATVLPTSSAAAAVAGFGLGLAVGMIAVRRRRTGGRSEAAHIHRPDADHVAAAPGGGGDPATARPSDDDRASPAAQDASNDAIHPAVWAAIDAYDLADSENQRLSVRRVLERFDINLLDPVGATFDHRSHHVLEARNCPDPDLDMIIAATVRPGWRHVDGRIVRQAEVAVWRHPAADVR